MSSPIVIYDGECDFCYTCIFWVKKKLQIESIAFQSIDLAKFDLTLQECKAQVFVIDSDKKYKAVDAVIFLLNQRGNRLLAGFLKALGPLSRWGYFWVAGHRGSWLVRIFGRLLSILSK